MTVMAAGSPGFLGMREEAPPIVLASGSAVRAAMLTQAGLRFLRQPAPVDEGEIKHKLKGEGASPEAIAEALAHAKALHVSRSHPGALVIGADQLLESEGALFDKPSDIAGARGHLEKLSGRTHHLVNAAVVLRHGTSLWRHTERASLTMRQLSDDFISQYLAAVGPLALTSVGAYQLEGLGAQLFERVDGDFFTVLGLPLLPLLAFLRQHGALAS